MATLAEALATIDNPDIRHIVPISGGKDSSALAIYMLQEYPQIEVGYVFCDSECELTETYDYLDRLELLLGKPITRVSVFDVYDVERKPTRNAFDLMLNERYGGYLPGPMARWCTRELKIKPFEKYIGDSLAYSYIGIRADEDRGGYQKGAKPPVLSQKNNIVPVYPFKENGIGLEAVQLLLETTGLGLPDYYEWRSRSGCYFCFYQQIAEWQGLKERHPDLFEKAKQYERDSDSFTWVEGRTLDEIAAMPRRELTEAKDGCAICHL
ncbi:MAG: phosphoadenosine phosphosulfate reductase family protein [Kiritimatiellaeota bacterium]|nr:phosphoadenosine phosphosulfate reductase family protein [Kiritimatiellota bacterium]